MSMFRFVDKIQPQPAHKPKDDASKSVTKVQPFPKQVNLGKVVTGGSTTATVVTPTLANDAGRATMRAHATNGIGWRTFSIVNAFAGHEAVPIAGQPLEVRFNPLAHGVLKTQLTCSLASEDGGLEEREIELEGEGVNSHVQAQGEGQPVVDIEGIDPGEVEELRKRTGEAALQARALAAAQERAVGAVENEVETYKKKPREGISFLDLALLAVSIGTAGVGGVIATAVGPKLTKTLVGGFTKHALDTSKGMGAAALNGISESIQTGFAESAGSAMKSGVSAVFGEDEQPRHVHNDEAFSSNARINFFETQKDRLARVGVQYAATISKQETILQPLLRTDATAAKQAMETIRDTCGAQYGEAHRVQAFATTAQWAAATAQSVAGKRERFDLNGRSSVTDFSKGYGVDADKRYASGLLRIAVTMQGDEIRVTSAALDGLSQELADRMDDRPLLNAGMPIRIVVTSEQNKLIERTAISKSTDTRVWITRDESGSVNVKGRMPYRSNDSFFRSDEEAAVSLCQEVLSKPLIHWGLKMINTDDATGRT